MQKRNVRNIFGGTHVAPNPPTASRNIFFANKVKDFLLAKCVAGARPGAEEEKEEEEEKEAAPVAKKNLPVVVPKDHRPARVTREKSH